MAVYLPHETRVLVQGLTGHQGAFHARQMKEFGTPIVAGVTPGKGGHAVDGVPVYDTVAEAVEEHGANAGVSFVPAPFAKDAALEAIDAGLRTLVIITEHIPVHDTLAIVAFARLRGATIIGPNCPGLAAPNERLKLGILPNRIFLPGDVGVISRSGTLTYEIVYALTVSGLGQSTVIGVGGDAISGLSFAEVLEAFQTDETTRRIALVGEIGGTAEEEAAEYIRQHVTKPVAAYIAGQTAPQEKRMGHAGAIITRGRGTATSKIEALQAAGVKIAAFPTEIAALLAEKPAAR